MVPGYPGKHRLVSRGMIPEEFEFGSLDKELPHEWCGHLPVVSGPKMDKGVKKERRIHFAWADIHSLSNRGHWQPWRSGRRTLNLAKTSSLDSLVSSLPDLASKYTLYFPGSLSYRQQILEHTSLHIT